MRAVENKMSSTEFNEDNLELHKYKIPPENIVYVVCDLNEDGDLRIYKCEFITNVNNYEDVPNASDAVINNIISYCINGIEHMDPKDAEYIFFNYQNAFKYWKQKIKEQVKEYEQLRKRLQNLERNMKKAVLL